MYIILGASLIKVIGRCRVTLKLNIRVVGEHYAEHLYDDEFEGA